MCFPGGAVSGLKNVKVYASKYAQANALTRNLVYRGIKLEDYLNF